MRGKEVTTGLPARGAAAPPLAGEQGARKARLSIRRFKLETAVLLLLLFTFALLQFQDLFAVKSLSVTPDNVARYTTYAYDDSGDRGRSTIRIDKGRPLRWSCELRAGYQFPYCGYGITFDALSRGRGLDLSGYDDVVLHLNFVGPAERLRLNLARADRQESRGGKVRPGELGFVVVQGAQTVRLSLEDLSVPLWWAMQNNVDALRKPPRDNVTGMEILPGKGARNGRYLVTVDRIDFEGRQISQAQIYLGLLLLWVALISLFLLRRVLAIRTEFERQQAWQVRESRELRQAKTAAESASAAKSAFLANMSHELRTPLNAILGYAQMLEREPLGDRQSAAVRTIHQSGAHLLTLITDILDLAKIEAGRVELSPVAFDLHGCVNGVAEMMRIRASDEGLEFICDIELGVPRFVLGDERRLRQVLINLLGNAIKFTAVGKVSLQVLAVPAVGTPERLRIEVRDTGTGIDEAQKARIFEPFEQFGDRERQFGGTGLGLSISRQIVGLMGGRIEVDSVLGSGSRFWFEVPVTLASEVGSPLSPTQLAAPEQSGDAAMVPPPPDQLEVLLRLAMAGNMRAIRTFADDLAEKGPRYIPFAERLKTLAAAYQSPAILELVSRYTRREEVA